MRIPYREPVINTLGEIEKVAAVCSIVYVCYKGIVIICRVLDSLESKTLLTEGLSFRP